MEQIGSFSFGGGFGDIGVMDEVSLASLDLTDTLLGSAREELTASLGEASVNEYEKYHMGDAGGGIADISLTVFDSGLIQDAGIKPYTQDQNANVDMEDIAEMADMMGVNQKQSQPVESKKEGLDMVNFIEKFLATHDEVTKNEVNTDWLQWHESETVGFDPDGNIMIIDDEDQIGEDDPDETKAEEIEFDHLMEEARKGLLDDIIKAIA
jgi:hypothetical protein